MGHYDNCREGNCVICGQALGYCEHTEDLRDAPRANDIQHGGDHYKGAEFQHWDLIARNGIGYLEGVASKYPTRWRRKNGAEDVQKAIHYVDKILELIDDCGYRPSGVAPEEDLVRFFTQNGVTDVHERGAIRMLCTWSHRLHLEAARKDLTDLLAKAQAAA